MKIVDANVLLYAVNRHDPHHETARGWLARALGGEEAIGFAWMAVLAFLRVSTLRGVSDRPLAPSRAAEIVEAWLRAPAAVVVEPTTRHLDVLRKLLESTGTAGNLVSDAHLAALAIEHHGEIVSFDADFARFPALRWHRLG